MIDTVFGIKVRMSGLTINWYRPIIGGRLLDADYRPAENRPLPYWCISSFHSRIWASRLQHLTKTWSGPLMAWTL